MPLRIGRRIGESVLLRYERFEAVVTVVSEYAVSIQTGDYEHGRGAMIQCAARAGDVITIHIGVSPAAIMTVGKRAHGKANFYFDAPREVHITRPELVGVDALAEVTR